MPLIKNVILHSETLLKQDLKMDEVQKSKNAYWKENLKYLMVLLTIWFIVSYGAGIFFKDSLNSMRIGGFKLGFWFAQQGAMYVFVVLIFIYVKLMNKLDRKYGFEDQEVKK